MSGTTWSKFFWSDWQSEAALRLCSYAARGLWMEMLCIAAAHEPVGYVAVAGRAIALPDLARMTGGKEAEVARLVAELERNKVFSRDRHGRMYSRRMISDAKKAKTARENGRSGGNPNLGKGETIPASDNQTPNPPRKGGVKPQWKNHPLATSQQEPPNPPSGGPSSFLDQAIAAYPAAGTATVGRPKIEAAWAPEAAAVGEAHLLAATRAFAASPYVAAGGRPQRLDRWLAGKAYEPFLPSHTAAARFPGPADIRAAIVALPGGEDLAAGYLDRCGWRDLPDRAVTCASGIVLDRLAAGAGETFRALGIALVKDQAA